jgi:hypothetical protein
MTQPALELRRVSGADHYRVAFVQKSCGKRLSGRPGTENADLQRLSHDLLLPPVRMRAEVGEAVVEAIGRVTPSGGTIHRSL